MCTVFGFCNSVKYIIVSSGGNCRLVVLSACSLVCMRV